MDGFNALLWASSICSCHYLAMSAEYSCSVLFELRSICSVPCFEMTGTQELMQMLLVLVCGGTCIAASSS